ncbi:MgtC/SapB family protein [Natroniella sulfidigena]|uniref:MgtC/SapB family protein n=1 Tax=Natroniella sulfidigena TaxID=723921 RepID=UPI00200B84A6|nr:MgtC/SapB family protein [Natroniella sulfidigena]MCK8816486.1 MgtC/SapB family protein [Natroniella sulfidigena]
MEGIEIILRLLLACLLGGLVGLERERSYRPAGFRTYILVAVGSALIMTVSLKLPLLYEGVLSNPGDPGRIAAQVVSGIGFLGAGTIIREGFSVTGLTTAAGLWTVSGIGLAVGAGFYLNAVITTVLVMLTLTILNQVELRMYNDKKLCSLRIKIFDQPGSLGKIGSVLGENGIQITDASIEKCYKEANNVYINLKVQKTNKVEPNQLVALLTDLSGVINVKINDLG